jgi:hypothetical protein
MRFLSLRWWYAPHTLTPYPFPLVVVVGLMPPRTFGQPAHEWISTFHRLHKQIFDLPPTHTAYSNRYATYRLLLTSHDLPFTPYRLRKRGSFTYCA